MRSTKGRARSGEATIDPLSFSYLSGRPVEVWASSRPLQGQDGWHEVQDAAPVVVSDVYVKSGKQAVYRGDAPGASILRRRMQGQARDRGSGSGAVASPERVLSVSACFYFLNQFPAGCDELTHSASVRLRDAENREILAFGIGTAGEKGSLYASVGGRRVDPKPNGNRGANDGAGSQELRERGWYRIEARLDQQRREVLSVKGALVRPVFVPGQLVDMASIIAVPVSYNAASDAGSAIVHNATSDPGSGVGDAMFLELYMGPDSVIDDVTFGNEALSFEAPTYSMEGGRQLRSGLRVHQRDLAMVREKVHVYCTFGEVAENPMPGGLGLPRGAQKVALGDVKNGEFKAAVRLGVTDASGAEPGYLTSWVSDGALDYFGSYVRPETPYEFKLALDLPRQRMTAWCRGRGDEDWFMLVEDTPLKDRVSAISRIVVEQYPDCGGVSSLSISGSPWHEDEGGRAELNANPTTTVGAGAGSRFQSMRSFWRKPGRHVTVERDPGRWMGFPDIALTRSGSLVCAHCDGAGHGGGGALLVHRSDDRGRTWSRRTVVHPTGLNAPRLQRLKDGRLLVLGDLHCPGYDVIFSASSDEGRSWHPAGRLDPVRAGGHMSCAPSRVLELPDGSWLLAGSYYAGDLAAAWTGSESEQLEFYRSPDQGRTWQFHSTMRSPYPHSLSEASILDLPDGRLLLYSRENGVYPGVKAFSRDGGKSWEIEELPFEISGRTCAGFLKDGRVLLTFRSHVGRPALWAWAGDAEERACFSIAGSHFSDSRSVSLRSGGLHIENDGARGQFTLYRLRQPDSPESLIEVVARVKVLSNQGRAATLSVPFVGRLRLFPDRVALAHDPSVSFGVEPGVFHTYRVIAREGRMSLFVDGREVVRELKGDSRAARIAWTPVRASLYAFAFGNEDGRDSFSAGPLHVGQITPKVSGQSIWESVEATVDNPRTGKRVTRWSAGDGFPDQYQLDRLIEVDATVGGTDQGYSGWVELDNGELVVVNYTDDTAPFLGGLFGVAWIRATHLDAIEL